MRYSALLLLGAALAGVPMSAQPQSDTPSVFSLPGKPRPSGALKSSARAAQRSAPRFKIGGKEIILPGPSDDYEEVGDRLRTTFFELLTHPSDRLVSAYLSSQTLVDLTAGKTANGLGIYGMVQTPRLQEYDDCSPENFQQVLAGLKQSLGQIDSGMLKGQMQGAMSDQLSTAGLKSVALDGFKALGLAFQKPNATGYLIREAIQQADRKIQMVAGLSAIRVRDRLILVGLFRKSESPETVNSLRQDLEDWADRILVANK